MIYTLGRFLQLVGLCILPVGIAGNALDKMSERDMLIIMGAGVLVFIVGWLLQRAGRPGKSGK